MGGFIKKIKKKKEGEKKDEKPTSQLIPATKRKTYLFSKIPNYERQNLGWQMCLAFIKLTPICSGLSASRYPRCDRNTFYNCNDKQAKSCHGGTFSGPFVDGVAGWENVLERDNAEPHFIIIENKHGAAVNS